MRYEAVSSRYQHRQREHKLQPSTAVADRLGERDAADLFIATFTIAEIWRGIPNLPQSRRRTALDEWFGGPEGPQALFSGRILAFDQAAPFEWTRLMAAGKRLGRARSPLDMIIAATAAANDCVVVTANGRHFVDAVEVVNPLRL
ncbi:MAG: PIN domain-containing protein [Alphaproteobacteria bacterium]